MGDRCEVCQLGEVYAAGICSSCYAYRRRHHGRDRPATDQLRANERRLEREQSAAYIAELYRNAGGIRPRRA